MAENVNNIYNSYKYINQELSKYDTDNDGSLSVFELEKIQDETGTSLLYEDINAQYSDVEENKSVETLESKLQSIKDEQGIISSGWNAIKSFTGIGSSTKKCEQAIEDYKNGKITYEEADTIISEFSTKQKDSLNLVSNILTGVVAVAAVGSVVATGGLSLGVIAAGAAAGGITKAGLKFADRATNKVEGDALDGKQLAKDALSGALDGAVSVATMGIGTKAVTAKTVTEQTLKQTVIQGAKAGAIDGAISGAVTGAGDYTIEAALEEDVEFDVGELAKSTAMNAIGGATAGGILGGVTSGIQYNSTQLKLSSRQAHHPDIEKDIAVQLSDNADTLNKIYQKNTDEALDQITDVFDDAVPKDNITGRPKSSKSVFDKLANKFQKGKLTSTNIDECLDAIGDAYGTRIQMRSLTAEESQNIIEDSLKGTGITYQQFIKYIGQGDKSELDDITVSAINDIKKDVINNLKEAQTKDVFDAFINAIDNDKLVITELNNYGDNISSYFTPRQLNEIADVYFKKTKQPLTIVTQMDNSLYGSGATVEYTDDCIIIKNKKYTVAIKEKGAIKDSGYVSTQTNIKHKFKDNTIGNGELQIRGTELNDFADVEHIPYDIRSGKIIEIDAEYKPVFDIIEKMDQPTYDAYNDYLKAVYNWLRLKELGIETSEPVIKTIMQNCNLTDDALDLLSRKGLIAFNKSIHT